MLIYTTDYALFVLLVVGRRRLHASLEAMLLPKAAPPPGTACSVGGSISLLIPHWPSGCGGWPSGWDGIAALEGLLPCFQRHSVVPVFPLLCFKPQSVQSPEKGTKSSISTKLQIENLCIM